MNKIFCTLIGMTMSCAMLCAQNESVETSSTNTSDSTETHVYNRFVSKTSTWTVEEDGKVSSRNHSWNLNFLSLGTEKNKGHWSSSYDIGPDMIYIGFTEMANTKGFSYNPGSSWEWGFSLMGYEAWNRSRHFGFRTGLLLTRSSYRIKGDNAFHLDAAGNTVCDNELMIRDTNPIDYSKQRLIHWSWRVPVMLNFRTNSDFRLGIGAEAELRHHIRSRAKVGHNKKYYLQRNGLDVEQFGYNALISVGNEDFSVFGRYNLSDMFGSSAKVDCQPFMIGVSFNLDND